jgi:hypothetical protein
MFWRYRPAACCSWGPKADRFEAAAEFRESRAHLGKLLPFHR